jgi:uncharacterized membrane protein YhaH (DUF805 family)
VNWYLQVLQKYAVFSGRARRMEYWMFVLFNILISIGLGFIDGIASFRTGLGVGVLSGLYALVMIIPSIAVGVRRLHDTDRTGWWCLIGFVPFIGAIVLLIFFVLDSTPGSNRFGANPKGA